MSSFLLLLQLEYFLERDIYLVREAGYIQIGREAVQKKKTQGNVQIGNWELILVGVVGGKLGEGDMLRKKRDIKNG